MDNDNTATTFRPWPPSVSLLTHIAYAGALDEIANSPHTNNPLKAPLTTYGRSRSPDKPTQLPFVFLLYQTGRHGPQNGFRLIVAEQGLLPDQMIRELDEMGSIEAQTAEMVYFGMDGTEVVPDVRDGNVRASQVSRRMMLRLSGLGHCERGIVHVDGMPGSISRRIRELACYPLPTRKHGRAISDAPVTGRGILINVQSVDGSQAGVLLVKEGCSPQKVEEAWFGLKRNGEGSAIFVVFEADGAVMIYSYDGHANAPIVVTGT